MLERIGSVGHIWFDRESRENRNDSGTVSSARITSRSLQVTVGGAANPNIGPSRRNHKLMDPLNSCLIVYRLIVRPHIAKPASRPNPSNSGLTITYIPETCNSCRLNGSRLGSGLVLLDECLDFPVEFSGSIELTEDCRFDTALLSVLIRCSFQTQHRLMERCGA
jgi:hypothetical protein